MTSGSKNNWPTSYQTFKLALSSLGRQIWPAGLLVLMHLTWFFFISAVLLLTSSINAETELIVNFNVSLIMTGVSLIYFVVLSIASTRLAQFNEPSGFVKLFDHKTWMVLLPTAALLAIYSLMISAGTFLLIIPGVLAFIFFSLAPFVLIWEEMSLLDSFRQSMNYVKGLGWHLLMRVNFFFFLVACTRVFAIVPGTGQTVSFVLSLLVTVFAPFYMGEVYRQVVIAQKTKLSEYQVTTGTKVLAIVYGVLTITFLTAVIGFADFIATIYPYPFAMLSVF
jgi:hypothetical protein